MRRGVWVIIMFILGWGVWQSHTSASFSWAGGGGGTNVLVSVASNGTEGNNDSYDVAISGNGEWVAFYSRASNLVISDTNGFDDLFLRHLTDGITIRITVGWNGVEANFPSTGTPYLSADGRWLAFTSNASNLIPNDRTAGRDCYLYDRTTNTLEFVALTTAGAQVNQGDCTIADMTPDGRFITFTSPGVYEAGDAGADDDVFLRDRQTGTTTRISRGAEGTGTTIHSSGGALSNDGRWVSFSSESSTLVPDDTNDVNDVFLYDRDTDTTTRVSVASNGEQGYDDSYASDISADGQVLFFESYAGNFAPNDAPNLDVFAHDKQTGETTWLSPRDRSDDFMGVHLLAVSANGRYVLLASDVQNLVSNDTYASYDLFIHDRAAGVLFLVSVAEDGSQANGDTSKGNLSADGRQIVMSSQASNLVPGQSGDYRQIVVRTLDDSPLPTMTPTLTPTASPTRFIQNPVYLPLIGRQTGFATYPRLTNLTTGANGVSFAPVSDATGATVAFISDATNLVPHDTNGVTDAFVWQNSTNQIRRVSIAGDGTQANGVTTRVALSDDGRYVLFVTEASTLAAGDTNGLADVYRHDLLTGATEWVSVGLNGAAPDGIAISADISADGRWVVFSSQARNITTVPLPAECPEATCETLYRRDMLTGVTETWLVTPEGVARAPLRNPSLSADGQAVVFEQRTLTGYTDGCPEGCLLPLPVYDPFIYLYKEATRELIEIARSTFDESIRSEGVTSPLGFIERNRVLEPVMARGVSEVLYRFSNSYSTQYGGHGSRGILSTSGAAPYSINTTSNGERNPLDVVPPIRYHAISADGEVMVFAVQDLRDSSPSVGSTIDATPDFPNDINNRIDIYGFDAAQGTYQRITRSLTGTLSNGNSREPFVSANGRVVVFASEATNLSSGDSNGMMDVFVWETVR